MENIKKKEDELQVFEIRRPHYQKYNKVNNSHKKLNILIQFILAGIVYNYCTLYGIYVLSEKRITPTIGICIILNMGIYHLYKKHYDKFLIYFLFYIFTFILFLTM